MTTAAGAPIAEAKNSLTAGPQGPVLLQDTVLQEKIAYFARERTPPRNVHALGFGGFGKFTVTHDISKYTTAKLFEKVGNSCETFTRFSGVFTERGDAGTIRDLRGWATKFYTTEGNWDVLAVNTPIFNARDMKVGPDAIHAFKRDPRTGDWYSNQTWDFVATHPEALYTQLLIWTDKGGTPKSFRKQNWFPCNTYSMTNAMKERVWIRFQFLSQQGVEGMSRREAQIVAGEDPNFHSHEMREAIDAGMHPKWKMYIQVATEAEGYAKPTLFDCTKEWPIAEYPLIEAGEVEVNRNPDNYHTTTEIVAFSPHRIIPGIGFSPDKLLQGRLMLYELTQAHRLGTNYQQIPINCPFASKTHNFHTFQGQEPGSDAFNKDVFPHYFPSLFGSSAVPDPSYREKAFKVNGDADYYPAPNEYSDEDIYVQPRNFLNGLPADEWRSLVDNLAFTLSTVDPLIVDAIQKHFNNIKPALALEVRKGIEAYQGGQSGQEARELTKRIRKELGNPAAPVSIEKHRQAV